MILAFHVLPLAKRQRLCDSPEKFRKISKKLEVTAKLGR